MNKEKEILLNKYFDGTASEEDLILIGALVENDEEFKLHLSAQNGIENALAKYKPCEAPGGFTERVMKKIDSEEFSYSDEKDSFFRIVIGFFLLAVSGMIAFASSASGAENLSAVEKITEYLPSMNISEIVQSAAEMFSGGLYATLISCAALLLTVLLIFYADNFKRFKQALETGAGE